MMSYFQYKYYFFTNHIIDNIEFFIKLYSAHQTDTSINTNEKQVEKFLSIHLLSGIIKTPSYRMYWAEGTLFSII